MRCLPESLSGLPEDRWAQLSVGLFWTNRQDHLAAVSGSGKGSMAAVCLQPLRRVRRGLSGKNRYPEDSTGAAAGRRLRNRGRRENGRGTENVPALGLVDAA